MNRIFSTIAASFLMAATAIAAPIGGPQVDRSTVDANNTKVYHITLRGNEDTQIVLEGVCPQYGADIDLWVYDENHNLIIKSTSVGCYEQVHFVPRWTGVFRIEVENKYKPFYTPYELMVY